MSEYELLIGSNHNVAIFSIVRMCGEEIKCTFLCYIFYSRHIIIMFKDVGTG